MSGPFRYEPPDRPSRRQRPATEKVAGREPTGEDQVEAHSTHQPLAGLEPSSTSPDLQLDGLEVGRRRRDGGVELASAGSALGWRFALERTITELAATGRTFSADDCRDRLGPALGSSPNSIGAAFAAAARRGKISCVGYQQSRSPSRSAGVIRLWRGTGA